MAYSNPAKGSFLTRAGNYNIPMKILDQEITLSRFIDFSVDNLTAGATYKLWSVPAGFQINQAYASCVATETTDKFDIVDDDVPTTTIIENVDLSAIGKVTAVTARKYYAADGFICIKPDHALATAKVYVTIVGIIQNTKM